MSYIYITTLLSLCVCSYRLRFYENATSDIRAVYLIVYKAEG